MNMENNAKLNVGNNPKRAFHEQRPFPHGKSIKFKLAVD